MEVTPEKDVAGKDFSPFEQVCIHSMNGKKTYFNKHDFLARTCQYMLG